MKSRNVVAKRHQSYVFIIIIGIVGAHTNAVMPAIISTLARAGHFGVSGAGVIASLELLGLTLSIVLLSAFVTKVPIRMAAQWGSFLLVAINLFSIFITSYFYICIFRFFSGAGAGLLLGLSSNRISTSTSPQKMFGIFYLFNSVLSFIAFQIWHDLENFQGGSSPFVWLSAISLLGVLASFQLLDNAIGDARKKTPSKHPADISLCRCIISLISIFLFYLSNNCLWSHIIILGTHKGIRPDGIHQILSYAILSQMGAMSLAAWIGSKFGAIAPLLWGSAILYAAMLSIINSHTHFVFFAAVFFFIFSWSFITPFVMGSLSFLDPKGRLTTLSIAALYGGLAVAPSVVGTLLKFSSGEFRHVFGLSIVLFPLSLLSLALSLKRSRPPLSLTY
ncbi:MAG: hypothetical protein RBT11_05730 [Desulfobacterales bacterium]|jgi:predicted MFS family arabinose efflux permease|nr:hypothetical protein [Desulfobacterales bacterium]